MSEEATTSASVHCAFLSLSKDKAAFFFSYSNLVSGHLGVATTAKAAEGEK